LRFGWPLTSDSGWFVQPVDSESRLVLKVTWSGCPLDLAIHCMWLFSKFGHMLDLAALKVRTSALV
jgi:hypothetical protein